MLPQFYKFVVVNNSGQANVFSAGVAYMSLRVAEWYITPSTGKVFYNQRTADDVNFTTGETNANGAEEISDEVDNSINKYLGAQVQLEVAHSAGAAADGTFDIYMASGSTSGTLPTDESGYVDAESNKLTFVGSLTWLTGGSNNDVQTSNTFSI